MSEVVDLPVEWDDDGTVTVGHPIVDSPAFSQVHWIDDDLAIDSDGVEPDRFGQVRAVAAGPGVGDRSRAVCALLGLDASALDLAARGSRTSVSVSADRLPVLGRAAAVGAGLESALSLGEPSPWWAVDGHRLDRLLTPPAVALGFDAAPSPSAAVEQILAGSWIDLGATAEDATAELALMATDVQVSVDQLVLTSGAGAPPVSTPWVEPGMLPVLDPGQRLQIPMAGLDVRPEALDLRAGVEVARDDRAGLLTVTARIADGAYHPDARGHRVVVRRRDSDVIIAEAPMEVAGTEHVAATFRLSRHSLSHALAIRLVDNRVRVHPDRYLAEMRAGRSLALAAASLARLGHLPAAEDLFGRSAEVWRSIGHEERAAATQGAVQRAASAAPLFAESLIATEAD